VLKNAHYQFIRPITTSKGGGRVDLYERRWVDNKGEVHTEGLISFLNPTHVSALLCHFSALKGELSAHFQDDFYYLVEDFEKLMNRALKKYPLYAELANLKIDGISNQDIQEALQKKFGIRHSVEYISSLWRNKIPKLIAEQEKRDYLVWYYTNEAPDPTIWKKCSHCQELKPRN
jgi:hypothetical protein